MEPEISALRKEIAGGRMAIREAIEFASPAWEVHFPPRPGETEVWSARETTEHAISTEFWFASLAGVVVGVTVARPHGIELLTPREAIGALDQMAITVDEVYSRVTPADLERETDAGRTVASVMRWSAWHLHDHAKQIAGIQ